MGFLDDLIKDPLGSIGDFWENTFDFFGESLEAFGDATFSPDIEFPDIDLSVPPPPGEPSRGARRIRRPAGLSEAQFLATSVGAKQLAGGPTAGLNVPEF